MNRSQSSKSNPAGAATRTLRLAPPIQDAATVTEALMALPSVLDVRLEPKRRLLHLRYDNTQVGIGSIYQELTRINQPLATGRLNSFKRSLYVYFDENVKAHARRRPVCCSNAASAIRHRR
jgi:hypothetical protein